MPTRQPAIKPGDVVAWLDEPTFWHWQVVEVRGSMLVIEREMADSRGNTYTDRRLAQRRAVRLVGSQTEMELPPRVPRGRL